MEIDDSPQEGAPKSTQDHPPIAKVLGSAQPMEPNALADPDIKFIFAQIRNKR
jgi:hypothetical protein